MLFNNARDSVVFLLAVFLVLQKTFKRELEVENWIKKYDEEMGEKQVYIHVYMYNAYTAHCPTHGKRCLQVSG